MIHVTDIHLLKRIVHAKLFIEAHHPRKIGLSDIAEEASFSKFHFLRLFKCTYGFTPHQYLMEVRLRRATKLLAEGKLVQEVCWSVGFESVASFSLLFKRKFGLAPTVFAKDLQKKLESRKEDPFRFIPNCFVDALNGKERNFR